MGNCFGRCLPSGRNSLRHSTDEQETDELVQEDDTKKDNFIFKIIKFKKKKNRQQFIDRFWEQNESNYKRLNPKDKAKESSDFQLQCLDANNLLKSSPATTAALDLPLAAMRFGKQNYQQFGSVQSCSLSYSHHKKCNKSYLYHPDGSTLSFSCCNNNNNNTSSNQINSSRASSSLDLEWEHEYGPNEADRRLFNMMPDMTVHMPDDGCDASNNHLTQSWYYLPSDDDEYVRRKRFNISNQQLLNICDDGCSAVHPTTNDDDDDGDDKPIDVVNCKDTTLIGYDNLPTHIFVESQTNFFGKKPTKYPATVLTPTPTTDANSCEFNLQQQLQQQQCYTRAGHQQQQQHTMYTRTPSRTSWSHISTPESLEWDIDEEQQKQLRVEDDNLDHETLELLHEIELLKNKVLNETGTGLIDDKYEMHWKDDNS